MRHSQTVLPGLSDAEIAAIIDGITLRPVNNDPGWRTLKDWSRGWGVSIRSARLKCAKAEKAGLMKREKRHAGQGKSVRFQLHYKFVGKSK